MQPVMSLGQDSKGVPEIPARAVTLKKTTGKTQVTNAVGPRQLEPASVTAGTLNHRESCRSGIAISVELEGGKLIPENLTHGFPHISKDPYAKFYSDIELADNVRIEANPRDGQKIALLCNS